MSILECVRHRERATWWSGERRALPEVIEFVPCREKGMFIIILAAICLRSKHTFDVTCNLFGILKLIFGIRVFNHL